ncbi:MAG: flagellar biosynthetic protein FliO [Actinomycetota bacterium]|nr:flagellar biosynthetic protein FliO [Actinomycetota bacterium]
MPVATLFLRLALALAVVFVLMAVAARLARRHVGPGSRLGRRGGIEVLGRASLSKSSSVVVVRLSGRDLVLGVTSQQVNLLGEAAGGVLWPVPQQAVAGVLAGVEPAGVEPAEGSKGGGHGSATPASAWKAVVEQLRERTVRHA